MKKRSLMLWVSILLTLTMLFAACETKPDAGDGTNDPAVTTPAPGDPTPDVGSDADKQVIITALTALKTPDTSTAPDTEMTPADLMELLNSVELSLENATASAQGQTGAFPLSATVKGSTIYFNYQGTDTYVFLSESGEILMAAKPQGETEYMASVQSLSDLLGGMMPMAATDTPAEDPSAAIMEILAQLPMPTLEQLEYKGNGAYALTEDYYITLLGFVFDQMGAADMDPTELRAMKATFESYIKDIKPYIAFTVENAVISKLDIQLKIPHSICEELMGMKISEQMSLELGLSIGLTEASGYPVSIAFKGVIPTGEPDGEAGTMLISFTSLDLALNVNMGQVNVANGEFFSAAIKVKQYAKYFQIGADNALTEVPSAEADAMVAENELALKLITKTPNEVIGFVFDATNEGEKATIAADLRLTGVTAPVLPAEVTALKNTFEQKYLVHMDLVGKMKDNMVSSTQIAGLIAELEPYSLIRIPVTEAGVYLYYFVGYDELTQANYAEFSWLSFAEEDADYTLTSGTDGFVLTPIPAA